jgi:hypothetical protein
VEFRAIGNTGRRPTIVSAATSLKLVASFAMRPVVGSSLFTLLVLVAATAAGSADLKARCTQLTSFYDRYGAGRSENSDGARNPTRIGAAIDCDRGNEEGVLAMEDLLRRKKFDVPPPAPEPAPIAQAPLPRTVKPEL